MALDIDKKFRFIILINGDKGLNSMGGALAELPRDRLREMREEAYVWWLARLAPLKKDEFTLAPLPDAKGIPLGSPEHRSA